MNNQLMEIKSMWRVFAFGKNKIFELRALSPKGTDTKLQTTIKHFDASKFNSLDECRVAIENEVFKLNSQGYNVYAVMNPLMSNFSSNSARDVDIEYRDLILIDIDRKGNTDNPANELELKAARQLALKIKQFLSLQDWENPIVVMSGNGYHLYYVLDAVSNNPESTMVISKALKALAHRFNNDIVSIDTTVYNAARITKVPGTVMRKGIATEECPYRMAVVCDDI